MNVLRWLAIVGLCLAGAAFVAPGGPLVARGQVVPTCFDKPATIYGLSGSITGTNGPDVIVGSDADDVIRGRGGNDTICGAGGNDTISGGSGNDEIFGDAFGSTGAGGDDILRGDTGEDVLIDEAGINDADGGSGRDQVYINGTAKGGPGNDIAVWAFGDIDTPSLALGGSGNDYSVMVDYGVADGGSGSDGVYALRPGSEARGGSGNDELFDGRDPGQPNVGPVTLNGGSGRDVCTAKGGDDTLISCERVIVP